MALKNKVGTTWKDIVVWHKVGTVWKKVAVHHKVSTVWKQITTLIGATLPSTMSGYSYGYYSNSTTWLTINSTGAYVADGGSSGTWMGGGSGSDYQVRATTVSGTLSGGSGVGSWLALSSARQWYHTHQGTGQSTTSWVGTIEIRMAASPNTVLTTSTVTLSAERDNNL